VSEATLVALAGWMSKKMLERYSHSPMESKRDAVKFAGTPTGSLQKLLNSKGQLTALFLKNLVRSWNILPCRYWPPSLLGYRIRWLSSYAVRLGGLACCSEITLQSASGITSSPCYRDLDPSGSRNFIDRLDSFSQPNRHGDNSSKAFYFCPELPSSAGGGRQRVWN
jgi:hypothetical protein